MQAACRLHASLHEGCSTSVRSLHTLVCRLHTSVWSLHTGVMRPALRRYAGRCMLQHAAPRSYAGCCSMHAGCCNLHTPVCRLQPESLGCIRSHFEKCTWLVKCCRFKAARPPRCGVHHWLDCPSHAVSSDLRGESCNFVTMSNSYRILISSAIPTSAKV